MKLNNLSKMNKGMPGLEDLVESSKQMSDLERSCTHVYEIFKIVIILSSK